MEYDTGDKVQVYIPLANDPEHRYHGEIGEIIDIFEDALGELTDSPGRGRIFTVRFDDPQLDDADFRYSDLQKPD